ncbi:MAG: cupin-like domain-containing protein [Bdellovibrionia bacterium]
MAERLEFSALLLGEQVLGRADSPIILKSRNSFYRRISEKYKNSPPGAALEVPRERLSAGQFKNSYFKSGVPVVFNSAAERWPCTRKWDFDFFSRAYGTSDILLVASQGLTTLKPAKDFEVTTVHDLVNNIKSGGDKYLRFSPLLQKHPELASDLDLEWLNGMKNRFSFGNTYYLFMGGKGTVTHLHNDQPCNLFVQVHGRKKWTLFSPTESHLLYPRMTQTAYCKSETNLSESDQVKHPLLRNANRWEVILNPGDVLYVPPHVWHHVENLTDTIGLGYRFSSIRAAFRSSPLFTILRVLAQNPPMWKTRKYGKTDTNLIWAHSNGNANEALKTLAERRASK